MKKTLDAVMFIDLDDFKGFNDNFSHACGDEVLKFVADTLKEISFERGFAGRFGGDEFVLCLTGLTVFGDSGKVAQDVIDILGKGFDFDHEGTMTHHAVRCSIGIAFLRESGKTVDEILAAADVAMYDIKKKGKSNYAYAKASDKDGLNAGHIDTSTSAIDAVEETAPDETAAADDGDADDNKYLEMFEKGFGGDGE
jgi:diguanylate cyclase (GGDEF)-like protein